MKLVPDWKQFPKWFSTHIVLIGSVAPAAWMAIPDDVRAAVPQSWLAVAGAVFFAAFLIGRIVDQG